MALNPPFVILDDARKADAPSLLFANPRRIVSASKTGEVAPALIVLNKAIADGFYAAGYFGYELGLLLEPKLQHLLPNERKVPLLWFGIFDRCETIDVATLTYRRAYAGPLAYEWDEGAYERKFQHAHGLITAGDIYQANISQRARFSFLGDAAALYLKLRATSRSAHCAYIDDGTRQILSLSPERFFEISEDGTITTRPMKGTAARQSDPSKDAAARAALAASDKDRAENLMIVDLLRNDLGRISEMGSVKVESLFEVETYPTVHQMVSTVTAKAKRPCTVEALLHALFPCGSVTGTPKIRAMEIINEIETSPRGVYCGAIGCFRPDGSAAFNVAIRTLTIEGSRGELGIGSAVVYDSTARDEYAECLLKAKYYEAARQPLQLIETLRYDVGKGFTRLLLHLQRMKNSAAAFGLAFNEKAARTALDRAVAAAHETLRIRLTLDENGNFACTCAPLGPPVRQWHYTLSPIVMLSSDELLQHKTSWREIYESEHARAAKTGCDEVLFFNERGELTEGSRSNVFLKRDGRLVTPPLSCGLLNGCLRQEMLDKGEAIAAVLRREDLLRAEAVYFGNSLRGLVEALPTAHIAASAA